MDNISNKLTSDIHKRKQSLYSDNIEGNAKMIEIAPPLNNWPYPAIPNNFEENPHRWQTVTEDFYWDQLGSLPPIQHGGGRFMVGECHHSDRKGDIYCGVICVNVDGEESYFAKLCYEHEFQNDCQKLCDFLLAPSKVVS
jgi:hypothetical protein